ncbi:MULTISPECIES: serine hydrolase domain-containing protein [unclassified Carboxylicivirga]|uniref:serine hydrolase domain-containing protein n=1 Tax=Carboxylicivirga TaxID=1628153 RepID=UPI003D35242B
MRNKPFILKMIILSSVLALVIAAIFLYPLLRGASGYAAKMVCSGVFVEGLSPEKVEQMELSTFPFNKVVNVVNKETQTVVSTIGGIISQTAVYEPGVGATLYPKGHCEIAGRVPLNRSTHKNEPWPMGCIIADTVPEGVDADGLKTYIDQHFTSTSRAVVVIKDGQLIAEKYADGIDVNTPLLGWSMTKSITAALTGILIKEGKLELYKPAKVSAWQNDERRHITLHNLLQMSSGLRWNEDYSQTRLSDVSQMLYIEPDMYAFATSVKSQVQPDSLWYYSSGTTNIIAGLLRHCFDDYQSYYQFPQKALFNKLGMRHSLIETDATGTFAGSSYGYCSARDWARFGMLYLNKGTWMGEQILPEWWVDYSTMPAKQSKGRYGAHIWLNTSGINIPNLPKDAYYFNGYRGQRITIIPSHNMVVVCLNSSPDNIDFNDYLKGIMAFVNKK